MSYRRDLDDEDLLDRGLIEAGKLDRAERLARAEQQAADRAAEDAALARRQREFDAETLGRALAGEYRAAGVEPLRVNEHGVPTCSLAMLRKMGWTIQEISGVKKLVAPPPPPPEKPRPPKECS